MAAGSPSGGAGPWPWASAVTLTGTQYFPDSEGIPVSKATIVAVTVDHPGPGTTTQYTWQVSNLTPNEIARGLDDWSDYSSVTVPSKTAAEKFGTATFLFEYARIRLKAVTTLGSGAVTIRANTKDP